MNDIFCFNFWSNEKIVYRCAKIKIVILISKTLYVLDIKLVNYDIVGKSFYFLYI